MNPELAKLIECPHLLEMKIEIKNLHKTPLNTNIVGKCLRFDLGKHHLNICTFNGHLQCSTWYP